MLKRKRIKEESNKARVSQKQSQQQQQQTQQPFTTTPQMAQASNFNNVPASHQRTFSTPNPDPRYLQQQQEQQQAPVLTFPQAAYTSSHQQSDTIPATTITKNQVRNESTPPPQQQIPSEAYNSPLFRKLSVKKTRQEAAVDELPPLESKLSDLHVDRATGRPVMTTDYYNNSNDNNNTTNNTVRRVGSMKITTKEKQQLHLPPLPASSRQQIQHHQRAASAYTPKHYVPDFAEKPLPSARKGSDNSDIIGTIGATGADTSGGNLKVPETRKYHPSARAKSMGHARKHSLNINTKSTSFNNTEALPPLPTTAMVMEDGFFDDVDMDDIPFDGDYTKPKRRPADDEIISQFEHAAPGSMPSIEYPKTLFLKGFFSVQTTSTKPLPIIRYDIISVLPQMGVKFTEVKGGFVCIHYPSIVGSDGNNGNAENADKTLTDAAGTETATGVPTATANTVGGGPQNYQYPPPVSVEEPAAALPKTPTIEVKMEDQLAANAAKSVSPSEASTPNHSFEIA
ncbi:unnamed protein product [Ambrosiozyma monospora]|uniref:Unnamed protein product n=1 Tax=Ambrosiozyma monospora TaxID=43982 RepID=A0ACB5U1D6_AMBMO|nr:unnamed protein product [Ambrosiozyma monospora]